MRLPSRLISALPLSAAVALNAGALAAGLPMRAGASTQITAAELTPQARATLRRELGDAPPASLSLARNAAGDYFIANLGAVELAVGPDGLVHSTVQRLDLPALPQVVRAAVNLELPAAVITAASLHTRALVQTYHLDAALPHSRWSLAVAPSGTILDKQFAL